MKNAKSIILASASPRREQLLKQAGLKFTIDPANYKELIKEKLSPSRLAKRLSFEKAVIIAPKYKNALIIAADTLVTCKGKILGKPKNEEDAKKMLLFLNGKMHSVITGFTLFDTQTNKFTTKSVTSKIYFNKISKEEINNYVTSKKPLDKAGAYGIQELPKKFVKDIKGDYSSIVGLPIHALLQELRKLGIQTS